MKKPPRKAVIGLAWYQPEQWQRLREIAEDVEILEENYADWFRLAAEKLVELQTCGLDVRRVDVDVNEILRWCNVRGLPVNAESRAHFVTEKVQKQDQGTYQEE